MNDKAVAIVNGILILTIVVLLILVKIWVDGAESPPESSGNSSVSEENPVSKELIEAKKIRREVAEEFVGAVVK